MKYLQKFKVLEFMDYVEKNEFDTWQIYNASIKDRYEALKNNKKYYKIHELADEKEISYNELEIISWYDNLITIYNAFYELLNDSKKKYQNYKDITIISEYHIPFSKNRCDYLLTKDNKILILEFSFANKESREKRYENKLNQVICYKELLKACLPNNITVDTYTCILNPTNDSEEELNKYNETVNYLKEFIYFYFQVKNKNALEELENIKDQFLK